MRTPVSTVLRILPALLATAPLAGVLAPAATAQTVGARERLVLRDGTVIAGTVVEVRDATVVIDANGIRSEVPRERIARVEAIGRFARVDPNGTRLFLTPTARTMPKGSLRLSTAYVVVPSVAYGVTGNLDVSLTALLPIADAGFVSGNVKYAPIQGDGFDLAVGLQAATVYGSGVDGGGIAGTFYGVGTLGSSERAVTVGAYGAYGGSVTGEATDGVSVGNGVAVVLGGENQVSNSLKLYTENGLLVPFDTKDPDGPSVVGIGGVGVRFFGDRLAADAFLPVYGFDGDVTSFFPISFPLLSVSYTIR